MVAPSNDRAECHVVVGPASDFTEWVFCVIEAMHRLGFDCDSLRSTALYEGRPPRRLIQLVTDPDPTMVAAIERGEVAVHYILVNPITSVARLMGPDGTSVVDAVRSGTRSAIANLAIGRRADGDHIAFVPDATVAECVSHIAGVLGFAVTAANIAAIADSVGARAGDRLRVMEEAIFARNPVAAERLATAEAQRLIEAVLVPLTQWAIGDFSNPVAWPTGVFFAADRPNEPADAVLDVTGPARAIYYGPYFFLPPHRYACEAELWFSAGIADIPFTLEFHGTELLARVLIDPRPGGAYRGSFHFTNRSAATAIEIRLRMELGTLEGQVGLSALRFAVDAPR